MIGIDSNVIIRFLVDDDPEQSALAREAIAALSETNPGYLTLVGMSEIYWTLRRGYKHDKAAVLDRLERLIGTKEFLVEKPDIARRALRLAADGADLGDALISLVGADAGCDKTITFDRRAAKRVGMRLLT